MDKVETRTRVVLVEDDEDYLEVLSMRLGQTYVVFGYASAVEAQQAIDAAKPDVLVLDIGMHPVDGVQCLDTIRATPGYHDIPAVALTGFARDVERQRFLDAGFQAVVVKPMLDHGELIAVIDQLVNRPAPAAPRAPMHPRRNSAASHLDGRAETTACTAGGSGETRRQGPA